MLAQELEILLADQSHHPEPMPRHDDAMLLARHPVGQLFEMHSKIRRTHAQFTHPPTLPGGSDTPEKKIFLGGARAFRIRGPGRRVSRKRAKGDDEGDG